jgi:dimethylglycine dehydrogenase
MGAYNGWERANWFAQTRRRHKRGGDADMGTRGLVGAAVREECEAVRDAAGILDLPGFLAVQGQGPGATEWLNSHDHRHGAETGPHRAWLFRRRRGRIVTEMSLMALDEDFFFLITAATAQLA